jgi:AcrR family transcriptional regulator
MDAAEALFIERGYEGTSIRDIARRASSHLGTLHYFWGNKDALFRAVCERRFDAIQAEQLRRLRACRTRLLREGELELSEIVRALVEPPLHVAGADAPERHTVRLLYGRVLTEPSVVVMRIVRDLFRQSTALFVELMRQRSSGLSEDSFYWRLTCAFGAFIFTQSFGDRVAFASGRQLKSVDWSQVADEVTGFIVRGFEAPAEQPTRPGARSRQRAAGGRIRV